MVIKLEYEDIGLVGIRTNYNGKIKKHYIRYIVDEYSIDKAIEDLELNEWVIALDYVGDLQYLFTINEKPKVPILVTKEVEEVTELGISFIMNTVPNWVVVVIKTPTTFSNMQIVELLSKEYPNIRFCGGKFLRLSGCRIGCIQKEDIVNKISESKISYYTNGCACIIPTVPLEKVEGLDMLYQEKEMLKEEKREFIKEEIKKKAVTNIEDLFSFF